MDELRRIGSAKDREGRFAVFADRNGETWAFDPDIDGFVCSCDPGWCEEQSCGIDVETGEYVSGGVWSY